MSEKNIEVREVTLAQVEVTDEMADWQPISSAPRDDDSVNVGMLLWDGSDIVRGFRDWQDENEFLREDGLPFRDGDRPTHWMPLPEPPA